MSRTGHVRLLALYVALMVLVLLMAEIMGRLLGIGSWAATIVEMILVVGLILSFTARLVRGAFSGRS